MKKLLLPILLGLLGLGGGVGAAILLGAPAGDGPVQAADTCAPTETATAAEAPPIGSTEAAVATPEAAHGSSPAEGEGANYEYAKLNNQFVVPIVKDGKVTSMVVLSLSIEVPTGKTTDVFAAEPKLRDVFLQALFDHANIGGFDGDFTSSDNMRILRGSLLAAGQKTLGSTVNDVLIIDILRQDV